MPSGTFVLAGNRSGCNGKGLWHLFSRHGEVVATFIARKLSRGGKRFGFVRFKDEVDAGRAMERLNDFEVYGYRIIVKPANQKRNKADSNQRYRSFNSSAEDRRKGLLWYGLDNGDYTYTLILFFLELNDTVGVGQRVFDIYINDEKEEENFDISTTDGNLLLLFYALT
ncbi:hypothetical protein V6N13_044613 [Hibiscus sabdariffa]|uniref:RRM domain-containing protein n=1 Tax=Hibiscus sabdariffa TaxID=183260 RepID=A0ABR2RIR8_9ROSI